MQLFTAALETLGKAVLSPYDRYDLRLAAGDSEEPDSDEDELEDDDDENDEDDAEDEDEDSDEAAEIDEPLTARA